MTRRLARLSAFRGKADKLRVVIRLAAQPLNLFAVHQAFSRNTDLDDARLVHAGDPTYLRPDHRLSVARTAELPVQTIINLVASQDTAQPEALVGPNPTASRIRRRGNS